MICEVCNEEVSEKLEFCPECGSPMNEPVAIKVTKEDIKNTQKKIKDESKSEKGKKETRLKADGPFINLAGFSTSFIDNPTNIFALVGALCVYLTPFMPWLWKTQEKIKTSATLFDLGGSSAALSVNQTIIIVMAVLTLVAGLMMLIFTARENIRPIRPFTDSYLLRLIPVVIGVVSLVIIMKNTSYQDAFNIIESMNEKAKSLGYEEHFSGGRGIGLIVYIVGLASYTLSVIFDRNNMKSKAK